MPGTANKKAMIACMCLICMLAMTSLSAFADSTATQLISIKVTPVSVIRVHGTPGLMEAFPSPDGSAYEARDASTSYSFYSTEKNRKISGSLSQQTPHHTALKVNLAVPSGSSSRGFVALSPAPADLVTGIKQIMGSKLPITYVFSATKDAGKVPLTTMIVTFTITGE